MKAVPRATLVENIIRLMETHSAKQVADGMARYLLATGRSSELNSIMRDVSHARSKQANITEVDAVTARQLSEEQKNQVVDYIKHRKPEAKTVLVNNSVDESVIGGIRLDLPTGKIDGTLRGQITGLRKLINQGKD